MSEAKPEIQPLTSDQEAFAEKIIADKADVLEQTLPADIPTLQPALDHDAALAADAEAALAADVEAALLAQPGAVTLDPPPPAPTPAPGREDYTLTSADAARINAHLIDDYVREGQSVNAARDADGIFVNVYESRIALGVVG